MEETIIYCIVIIIANGLMLSIYHYWLDPEKDIERYYFRQSKISYCVFKMSYLILLFSFVFSLRYLLGNFISQYTKKLKKKIK